MLAEWIATKGRDIQTPEVIKFQEALKKVVGFGKMELIEWKSSSGKTPGELILKLQQQIRDNNKV